MAMPIQVANVTCANSGFTTLVTNGFKTVAQAASHGMQRAAIIRVLTYGVQNLSGSDAQVSFVDSSGTTLEGPFVLVNKSSWTDRSSFPSFLFETTRNTSAPFIGFDLQLVTNTSSNVQAEVEWMYSFAPGKAGA